MLPARPYRPAIFMRHSACIASLAAAVLASGCANVNPYYDPGKPHHRPQGFANNYPANPAYQRPQVGFVAGWAGRLKNWTSGAPNARRWRRSRASVPTGITCTRTAASRP